MFSNKSKITSMCFKLIVLIVLCSFSLCIQNKIVIDTKTEKTDDNFMINQCSVEALATYIPNYSKKANITPEKGNDEVKKICPNLKFTCCKKNHLNHMANQLKTTLNFLKYRGTIMEIMLNRIGNLPPDNFKIFLKELTSDDINCYKEKERNMLELKKLRMGDNPDLLKTIEKKIYEINFSKIKMFKNFLQFQKMVKPYILSLIHI